MESVPCRGSSYQQRLCSRLAKRALKPHLNVYEFILLFRDEQLNKEAYILQIEGGQQLAKRRRSYDHVDSRLHQYG